MDLPFKDNFKVFVRIRPFLPRETTHDFAFPITDVLSNNTNLHVYEFVAPHFKSKAEVDEMLSNPKFYQIHQFQFDRIFDENSSQNDVFEYCAQAYIDSFLSGFNCSIFAYGQTGTGKTYTIEGTEKDSGIMIRVVEQVFSRLRESGDETCKLSITYLQVYNEVIYDLLDDQALNFTSDINSYGKKLQIKLGKERGCYVEGLREVKVDSASTALSVIKRGINNRFSASNNLNAVSSRSHAVFTLMMERKGEGGVTLNSKFNVIDLAGSERITLTGVSNDRLTETKKINMSLSELSNVILALSKQTGKDDFIQYRNSKLTRLLEDSLGGNTMTSFIATISPSHLMLGETLSTLKFAARARNIKTIVTQNKKSDGDHLKIWEKYRRQHAQDSEPMKIDNISEILPSSARDIKQLFLRAERHDGGLTNSDFDGKDERDKIIEVYQEMLMHQRDVLIRMTTKLNNRNLEIASLKKKMSENSKDNTNDTGIKELSEIKEGMDFLVDSLCKRNTKIDLPTIASKLITLQSKIGQLHAEKTGKSNRN